MSGATATAGASSFEFGADHAAFEAQARQPVGFRGDDRDIDAVLLRREPWDPWGRRSALYSEPCPRNPALGQ